MERMKKVRGRLAWGTETKQKAPVKVEGKNALLLLP
jgi:hypothetical protein